MNIPSLKTPYPLIALMECAITKRALTYPHPQRQGAVQAAHPVSDQIITCGHPTKQIDLMPLIKHPHEQRSTNGQQDHAPSAQTAGKTNGYRQHGKHESVGKLILQLGNQPHHHRLSAHLEQTEKNRQRQQHGQQTHMTL